MIFGNLTEEDMREKKAVKEVLQVLAANNLTAGEIKMVISDVQQALDVRPFTSEYVEQYDKDPRSFMKVF